MAADRFLACIIHIVNTYRKGLFAAFIIVLGLIVLIAFYDRHVNAPESSMRTIVAYIDGHKFYLEVADSPELRIKGLSEHSRINPGGGMLFVFEQPDIECFWMQGVDFPIDILWFDSEMRLIHKVEQLHPNTYPKSFCPPTPAQYVVELSSGDVAKHGFRPGDRLSF